MGDQESVIGAFPANLDIAPRNNYSAVPIRILRFVGSRLRHIVCPLRYLQERVAGEQIERSLNSSGVALCCTPTTVVLEQVGHDSAGRQPDDAFVPARVNRNVIELAGNV